MLRAIAVLILALGMLGVPALAHGQSAGDDQYVDPFEGQEEPQQEQEQPESEQPAAPTPPAESQDTQGTVEPSAESDAPALPRTGLPLVLLLGAGLSLLAVGAAMRRRL